MMFSKKSLVLLLSLAGRSEGFVVPGSSTTSSSSTVPIDSPTPTFLRNSDVSLHAVSDILNAGVPAALFGAAVFATVTKSDKPTEEVVATSIATPEPVVVEEEKVAEEVVTEEKEEELAETETVVEEEPEPEPIIEAVEPEPAAEPVPVPEPVRDIGKEITELRKQVTSTLDGEKEKLDRMKAAAEKKEEAVVKEIVKPRETPKPVVSLGVKAESVQKTGRKRRFVKKVVKKVIMPWKKWSDIS